MDIGTIISFTIVNALASYLGACIFKKKYPEVGTVKMTAYFFLGFIIFFWGLSKM